MTTEPSLVPAPGNIMIVDDNPTNLTLLRGILEGRGHKASTFPRGRLALAALSTNHPDLILLDINMPEMDGYEVCQRLKTMPEVADVPVIFLSALNDVQDKIKAFSTGAVDYISKPFHIEEVMARVITHLDLHRLQKVLREQNEILEATVAARTQELALAVGRLTMLDKSKTDFLNLIAHEFRTPLNGLLGVGELALDMLPDADGSDLHSLFNRARHRILSIISDAELLTEIDVNQELIHAPAAVSLDKIVDSALDRAQELLKSRGVEVARPAACEDLVYGNEDL